MRKQITAKEAREHLSYNPETGGFTWIIPAQGRRMVAGCTTQLGYRMIRVNGRSYFAHRLAWLMTHGTFPPRSIDVDHIDGNGTNNRLANLRLATRSENLRNAKLSPWNTSGVKGVCWHKNRKVYQVNITIHRKVLYLGIFKTLEEAKAVITAARQQHHGDFCRHA